jgi:Ig-like domain from next to BRCA1 gene
MNGIPKLKFITLLLLISLLSACAQAAPPPGVEPISGITPGAPTAVVVRILNLDLGPAATPTGALPTPTPLPTLAPPPTRAPQVAKASAATVTVPACLNSAEFVKNLSIADNTAFDPEEWFAKIWQIKNTGSCAWTTDYALVYASGDSMGSPAKVQLPQNVNPGETIDLRLPLMSPREPRTYTGNWYLQDASGATFGLGPDGTQPLMVTIVVKPLPRVPT